MSDKFRATGPRRHLFNSKENRSSYGSSPFIFSSLVYIVTMTVVENIEGLDFSKETRKCI